MIRKCLAIGVGSVGSVASVPDTFPYLDGAVVAAETIGQWALHSGFAAADVVVLTDKGTKIVTDDSLKNAFDQLVPAGTTVDHFVLAFAGHGLTGINDDTTYWLMSDSLDEGYSIFVEDMRRQLYGYGIQHLSIFSDACRAIANSRDLRGLLPRPGVRRRHQPAPPVIEVARFNACQDATSAFMVKTPGAAAPGKCIFSGVLAEALWGRVPDAFDGAVIDSSSLGRGLRAAAKARAEQYKLTLVPGGSAFFDKVIYFDQAAPPLPPVPDLAPWPAAEATEVAGAGELIGEVTEAPASNVFKSVLTDAAVRTAVLGASFGLTVGVTGFPGLPDAAKSLVETLSRVRRRQQSLELTPAHERVLSDQAAAKLETLEGLAAGEARRQKADGLRMSVSRTAPIRHDNQPSTTIMGAVKRVWSHKPIVPLACGADRAAFSLERYADALVMIEFADGLFAPSYFYKDRFCMVLRDADGVTAINYRYRHGGDRGKAVGADAVGRLTSGNLSAAEIDKLALKLRYEKHVNPVFGAIAAYCYDVTGDVNSIRRMASYYGQRDQAAPYDIVLMCMIGSEGAVAQVPEVPEDTRGRPAKLPRWLTERTPPVDVSIAGRCPWLRQGWDFLAAPEDVELPLIDRLNSFRGELTGSVFTTLKQEGGRALAERWQLRPYDVAM